MSKVGVITANVISASAPDFTPPCGKNVILGRELKLLRFPSAPVETPQIKVISGVSDFPRSQAPLGNARLEAPLLRIWISHLPWMPRPVVAAEETFGFTSGGLEVADLVPPITTDCSTAIHVVHHCDGSSQGDLRPVSTSTSTPGRNPHKIPNCPAAFGWHFSVLFFCELILMIRSAGTRSRFSLIRRNVRRCRPASQALGAPSGP